MENSDVSVSQRGENHLDCRYAIVRKAAAAVLVVVRNADCSIFDTTDLQHSNVRYLLLKHYPSADMAYRDFLKLIGKMCTKRADSKYFGKHLPEDNWMLVDKSGRDRMICPDERAMFDDRRQELMSYIHAHATDF